MILGVKKSVIENDPLWFSLFILLLEKKMQRKSSQMILLPDAALPFFPILHYFKIISTTFFSIFLAKFPTFLM